MQRREFIGTTVLAAAALTSSAFAADEKTKAPAKGMALNYQKDDLIKELSAFAEIASRCSLKGQVCLHHCEERLAKGETEFANCNTSVQQMIVICDATAKLSAMKSIRIKEMLDACVNACQACKDACDEHKAHFAHGMHLDCKECSEHCDKAIAAANKLKKLLAKA